MQIKPNNRYDLRDLHQEIDFFDRKIAYCQNNEKFDSEAARHVAVQKLVNRRETLAKAAREAVSRGVESEPEYLPRSFKISASATKD